MMVRELAIFLDWETLGYPLLRWRIYCRTSYFLPQEKQALCLMGLWTWQEHIVMQNFALTCLLDDFGRFPFSKRPGVREDASFCAPQATEPVIPFWVHKSFTSSLQIYLYERHIFLCYLKWCFYFNFWLYTTGIQKYNLFSDIIWYHANLRNSLLIWCQILNLTSLDVYVCIAINIFEICYGIQWT